MVARNRQIAAESFQVTGDTNSTGGLFAAVTNTGPLAIRVVAIFVDDEWTNTSLITAPEAINVDTTETLDANFTYTGGVVTLRVVTERGNVATRMFPAAVGANSLVIAAFDQILNANVDIEFSVEGEADGVTYLPGTPFNTGLTGHVFNDVVSLTVTMPDTDAPANDEEFRRWADGISANPRTFTQGGTYSALYGDPLAGGGFPAQGIGAFILFFDAYCRYTTVTTTAGGAPGYSAPNQNIYFAVTVKNKDLQQRTVTLTSETNLWMIVPGSSASDKWDVIRYRTPGIEDGCPNGLTTTAFPGAGLPVAYDETVTLYFGPTDPPNSFNGEVAAVFLMFFGLIGPDPYGQNIPFVGTEWS